MNVHSKADGNVKQVVPFLNVSNMERSVRYYVDGLGFTIKHKWVVDGKLRWCWLELGGAALMLQEFRREGHDSWAPEGKVGEPQVQNAMWVTGLSDPDGYRLYFESATDTPEEATLWRRHAL